MLAMQRLQPEIKRLQAKHKNDRQALNEAMMAFYKEHKINPLSGCLPQVIQFPVLIVMFRVLSGLTHTTKDGVLDPKYIKHSSELYQDLAKSAGKMVAFGVDFAQSAARTHGSDAIPLYLLIALVGAAGYWQSHQMTARNPQSSQNPQMQMMQRIFPLISVFISFTLPAGVVLYFLVSTLFRIAQQALMYRLDPALQPAALKQDFKEIDAKATEIERQHGTTGGQAKPNGGRTTPKATPTPSRNTRSPGSSGSNGARQQQRSSSNRSRARRRRRGR
jgi:YidC/Oxa1 family membrane protein insertase